MSSAPAIGFEFRPSRLLPAVLWVMFALVTLAVASCALPLAAKLLILAGVAIAIGIAVRRWSRNPVQAVGCGRDSTGKNDVWSLRLRDVGSVPATLVSSRVVGGFVLLRLRTSAHDLHTVLLGADNADADVRRRLRMRLAVHHEGRGAHDS